MSNIVTEHVLLLLPSFFVMMIFALVANAVVANYSNQQQTLIIQGAENQLSTTISQLYYSISQQEIQSCVVTKTVPLPTMIDGQTYTVNGVLKGNELTLTFSFPGIPRQDNTTVTLGPQAKWVSSKPFDSVNENSVIVMEKYSDATIGISFG